MYLRSYSAPNFLFAECYGELNDDDRSVFYKVTSTYFLPQGALPPSPDFHEQQNNSIRDSILEIITDLGSYTEIQTELNYVNQTTFQCQVKAKYGAKVGYKSIEDVMSHKHIGDHLFDYMFSNALEKQLKFEQGTETQATTRVVMQKESRPASGAGESSRGNVFMVENIPWPLFAQAPP